VRKNIKKTNPNFFGEVKNNIVDKKTIKKENVVDKKTIKKEVKTNMLEIVTDEHVITKYNQKVRVLNDVSTVDGTLHKDEIVTVENLIGQNIKVIDNLGRFWFINPKDISTKL
tara:strand:+ start:1613 stop:1951 length:339 start_codon:yes stop_codon:yes gene_type:complete